MKWYIFRTIHVIATFVILLLPFYMSDRTKGLPCGDAIEKIVRWEFIGVSIYVVAISATGWWSGSGVKGLGMILFGVLLTTALAILARRQGET